MADRFTAETRILDALKCAGCGGEGKGKDGKPCARCKGTGGEPAVVEAFQRLGLRCWRKGDREPCVAVEKETLADAALYHDMDLEKLLGELNRLREGS
jgi:hypothetical protein